MNKTKSIAEPGKQEVIVTCVFDAPRKFVFNVYTDPKLIPQWWGPRELKTTIDKNDLKPGGIWRYIQKDGKGNEFAFHGVVHSVKPPEQLVSTLNTRAHPGMWFSKQ